MKNKFIKIIHELKSNKNSMNICQIWKDAEEETRDILVKMVEKIHRKGTEYHKILHKAGLYLFTKIGIL